MNRISVSSSNLASVGYDQTTQMLEIEFLHGGIYQYSGVPSSVYDGLMTADSHGSYFITTLRRLAIVIKKSWLKPH
jgi:KTSC domain